NERRQTVGGLRASGVIHGDARAAMETVDFRGVLTHHDAAKDWRYATYLSVALPVAEYIAVDAHLVAGVIRAATPAAGVSRQAVSTPRPPGVGSRVGRPENKCLIRERESSLARTQDRRSSATSRSEDVARRQFAAAKGARI